ncbi:MAG TPA: hypothetical protein VGO92_02935 [Acidimicrobiales bacterium]|jgi:hypothetical protein|nr:hypothetical protein [Acidimicrobiales bacterium]
MAEVGIAPGREVDGLSDLGGYLTRTGEQVRWRRLLWADTASGVVGALDVAALDVGAAVAAVAEACLDGPVAFSSADPLVAVALLGVLGVTDGDISRLAGRDVVRGLREAHGSVLGFALDAGVDMASVSLLRDLLLH